MERAIGGNAGKRGSVLQHPSSTAVAVMQEVDPPKGLARHALAVWRELAPFACGARTLTPATAAAFAMLCRAVVQERALSASLLGAGGSDHRGMMARVSIGMKDFGIAPLGKPMYVAQPVAPPIDTLARFVNRTRG